MSKLRMEPGYWRGKVEIEEDFDDLPASLLAVFHKDDIEKVEQQRRKRIITKLLKLRAKQKPISDKTIQAARHRNRV